MKTEAVTALKRRATELIADLTEAHEAVLITQNGRPAAYLVDVDTYENLKQKLAAMESISRGEQDIKEGRVVSHEDAKQSMARWLK